MEKELKNYMSNVDEVIALLKKKVTRLEDDKQAAEARADRYEKALKDFATRLKEHCEKMGITSVVLQRITIDMEEFNLTPKTVSDE